MKKTLFILLFTSTYLSAKQPVVYNLQHFEYNNPKQSINFVSVSDRYGFGDDEYQAIPKSVFEERTGPADEYIKLSGEYRKRCMRAIGASENDVVYVYDYAKDRLLRYYIRSLNCVAVLNLYSSGTDYPVSPYEYMIGFEIDSELLSGYHSTVLVAIGSTNPFTRGKVKPVRWKKVSQNQFPKNAKEQTKGRRLSKDDIEETYRFDLAGLSYFITNYGPEGYGVARHLVVIDSRTKSILLDKFFRGSEGGSCAPLFVTNENGRKVPCQYAGQLFKNQPPVIFGFMWQSFGCPGIDFANPNTKSIYIHCDNRH